MKALVLIVLLGLAFLAAIALAVAHFISWWAGFKDDDDS
jgi:hypothetical protein